MDDFTLLRIAKILRPESSCVIGLQGKTRHLESCSLKTTHAKHCWYFSYLVSRRAPSNDRYLIWWQAGSVCCSLLFVSAVRPFLCLTLCPKLSLTHTREKLGMRSKNRRVVQKQNRLIYICVLLFWWMFGCFSYSEVSSPHTHTPHHSRGSMRQVRQVFSTRLGLNMSWLLRSSLHHHHSLQTDIWKTKCLGDSSFTAHLLCPLIGKQALCNRETLLQTMVKCERGNVSWERWSSAKRIVLFYNDRQNDVRYTVNENSRP